MSPMRSMGSVVMTNPMPIHAMPSGRMTVAKKSLPASRPMHAKYSEMPSLRSMRLAERVV